MLTSRQACANPTLCQFITASLSSYERSVRKVHKVIGVRQEKVNHFLPSHVPFFMLPLTVWGELVQERRCLGPNDGGAWNSLPNRIVTVLDLTRFTFS
jgi:hypothetical protein